MKLTKEQNEKLTKLGISSWSELSLFVPISYEDFRLKESLEVHKPQLIDATIESIYRAPNSIQITLFAHNFGYKIQGVLFRPKPYMLHQYKVGQRDYFYGVIECKNGQCSMSMPRKISTIGSITPKYKSALRTDVMQRFIAKNVNYENLIGEGLKEDVVNEVLKLHNPVAEMMKNSELSKESLHALKYIELYSFMKRLAGKRRYFQNFDKGKKDYDFLKWANTLPFDLTKEQINAIEDIKTDFSKDVAAKRMVVGDVGSGKTMVILASVVMNFPNRSLLMAPTTVLAKQLYEEALKFLPNIKTALVTNKTKKIDLEEFDFIIGTHALLYREIPHATLVMVDEQHRFGTAQRNMLEKMVTSEDDNSTVQKPHFLQFSATPIPRTQAMIETANIDVSLITSTPFKKDITSKVIHKQDFKDLLVHIKSEIEKQNQILIVYPLVEQSEAFSYQSIEEARGYWESNFENVFVTHGKDKAKEDVLLNFREKGNILISTTVVEVGISLPKLTTVVIVGAERLGLSTLHQLRGRVSRTGLKGYCYLYTNMESSKRLDEFVKTTSGFDIANLDLKYRKSGDLLRGSSQSGSEFKWIDLAEDEEIVKEVKSDLEIPHAMACGKVD
jgi:ATP-dependent DNA helicase RecG